MLAVKIVCILVIFLSIRSDVRQFVRPQVTKRSKLTKTVMALLLDFSSPLSDLDFDSILQLTDKLFIAFKKGYAELKICPVVIDDVDYKFRMFTRPYSLKKHLKYELRQRKPWKPDKRSNRFYDTAFNGLAQEFHKGIQGNSRSVALLITHGNENCAVEERCLNSSRCCGASCRSCVKDECIRDASRKNHPPVEVELFVKYDADQLKNEGVSVITVGVGPKADAARLKCWATKLNMFIKLASYNELPKKGANEILDLLLGDGVHTKRQPIIRSTTSILTVKPKPKFPSASPPAAIRGGEKSSISSSYFTTNKSASGQRKWHWWSLALAAIIVFASILALSVIGIIVCRWKREKRAFVPVVDLNDDGSATRYPHKPPREATFKSGFSSFYSTSNSETVKDPNFVIDQSTKKERKRPGGTTRSTGATSRASDKRYVATRHNRTAPHFDRTRKLAALPTKFQKENIFTGTKKPPTASNVKGLVTTGAKVYSPGTETKESSRKYETIIPKAPVRALPVTRAAKTKQQGSGWI